MSIQRRIYEQNANLTEAPRDVDVKPNPETKKMIEGGKMKVVKSAPSYLGGKSIFAVLENPKAGREDDKYVMACISDPKRGAIKMFSYHGSHPSADGAMKFADKHGLTESVELEEAKSKDIVKGLTDMDGPFTVVAIKNNKVIKQEGTKMRNMLPAIVKMMRKEVGVNVTIGIEDRKGTIRGTFKEDLELTESFEFQFADKETAQKFMREISQKRLGSSTGTSDGKVRTEGPAGAGVGSPTRAHQQMAKIMKKYGGKILRTDEGPRMKRVFKEDTEQVDELKSSTLRSYADKANKQASNSMDTAMDGETSSEREKATELVNKRRRGARAATSRLDARKNKLEPELKREDVEQVDELSDKTMKSYIKKAQKDNTDRVTRMADKPSHMPADKGEMDKLRKRQRGIVKAKTEVSMRKIAGDDYRSRMGEDVQEACWDSHVQQGTKMKKGKMVPNCVPKTESVEQVDEMKYLGKDKKFGRKFYEKDGQLHVVVNDGRPQNLGSVEVKGNAKMIKKLVKEESIDEAVFSKSQLDQIRAQYSKIKTVDPSQPTYGKLTAFLDKLDDAKLKQLSTAKIKFVSGLALNRVSKRKMK